MNTIEFKLNDNITYNLKLDGKTVPFENNPVNEGVFTIKTHQLCKINNDTNESILINADVFDARITKDLDMLFLDENIGFITSCYTEDGELGSFYRTEDGGKTFEKVDLLIFKANQ